MSERFDLAGYMSQGIESIIKDILKGTFTNPSETAYLLHFRKYVKKSEKIRESYAKQSVNIPPFLMASISADCNLYCKGCYARAEHTCGEHLKSVEMKEKRWDEIFKEAQEIGVSFVLLLGGEPLMRKAVIEKAAERKRIVFPIFTNGTMLNNEYIEIFDQNRNLVPMISVEGNEELTDQRRGKGTYQLVCAAMRKLKKCGCLFGCSITVTKKNVSSVMEKSFVGKLYELGARAFVYVEYVPVQEATRNLAPDDTERIYMATQMTVLRKAFESMIFLAFPGDEKYTQGCLSAGRGFFHINASGGAEPCPFSPYSDHNLKESTLLEALQSPLFKRIREDDLLREEHVGGCLLFEKKTNVEEIIHQ